MPLFSLELGIFEMLQVLWLPEMNKINLYCHFFFLNKYKIQAIESPNIFGV
jgi:hypothetical protein